MPSVHEERGDQIPSLLAKVEDVQVSDDRFKFEFAVGGVVAGLLDRDRRYVQPC
ncbi:MAG TPA: hypothetical protein VES20_15950 [Bryobacteraceae bacterium]|nr:hypothetical protein [Bryobacteraceae bacterium]